MKILRYPFGKKKFDKAFRKIGLKNALGEYPVLLSSKKDKQKEHGMIYNVKNMGISIVDFDNNISALEAALNLKIHKIEYGRNAKITKMYAIPFKYDKPRVISADSNEFIDKMINLLCVGSTGSGKSYALLTILGIFAKQPNTKIVICDYKNSSFSQFKDSSNYYGYSNISKGIDTVYQEFSERLLANDNERNRNIIVLLIDEYAAFISSLDKKEAEIYKKKIAELLCMSRSLGIKILIGMQRGSAELFSYGSRDNILCTLALGNLSKEQKSMLFYDHKDKMNKINGLGEGYLLIDGKGIERVKIAVIKDFDSLNANITKAMNR